MVVCDTSPLNYLVLIHAEVILPKLYKEVSIPMAVQAELGHPNAPSLVQQFIAAPPEWLHIDRTERRDLKLGRLDSGEIEGILLAEYLLADALIIDERAGASTAMQRGLRITGTLGVLDEAARRGLIDLPAALARLRETTFRISDRLTRLLLDAQRKS
jgi:predicted nucleic acid-binding protein